jgi:putative transposase
MREVSPSHRSGGATALGMETARTPARAPRANAIAERVVRTLRSECLDHAIPLHASHLRSVLAEYVRYDNTARAHRTPALQPPLPQPLTVSGPLRGRLGVGGCTT